MKSAIALVASAALASAVMTKVEVVYDVVTVTVTADPTDFVAATKPTSTATPEPVTTSAAPSPPPAPPVAASAAADNVETSSAAPPPPAPSPEPVQATPEPAQAAPEPQTQAPAPAQSTPESQPTQSENVAVSSDYKKTTTNFHNAYRKDHSASALEWDDTLASYAANTANSCVFEHDMSQGGASYGQNLASYGTTGDLGSSSDAVGRAIANEWYSEVKDFNFYGLANPPSGGGVTGHFTQLVWKSSQKVGCATVKCAAGTVLSYPSYYTVCNYSPPGNFNGRYAENVRPSLGLSINVSI